MTAAARFSMAAVREAVRRRVAATSLRAIAKEVGMSFSGLRSFAAGGNPQPSTRRKLITWYAQYRESGSPKLLKEDVEAAIALLHTYVFGAPRRSLVRERRLQEVLDRLAKGTEQD